MRRDELEHLIRAAGGLTGVDAVVVVGSQAILGAAPTAPPDLLRSMEADMFTWRGQPDSDLIDGCIGEGSPFHETFGYYAQGVAPETAVLPDGWRDRLIEIRNENTRGISGWCLDLHDLAASKLAAGREKDVEFIGRMVSHHLLDPAVMDRRLASLPAGAGDGADLAARWRRILAGASHS
jgi:hypothetical protein